MASFASIGAAFVGLAAVTLAAEDNLANLTKAVTAFKLANGAQFLVVERPYSPLIAFHLRVKAGTADEPPGRSGLASLALYSFLQGSEAYGSRNLAAEKSALAEADKLMDGARGDQNDDVKRARLEFQARTIYDTAANYAVRPRFYETVLVQNGATGVDMRSTADYSDLTILLPSNRAELWFRMIGSWLQAPSTRFFLQSRESVIEQRDRASKTGLAQRERSFGGLFSLHPYQASAGGEGDLAFVVPNELLAYLKENYLASNLTVSIVGDLPPADARRFADLYFGKLPAGAPAEPKKAEAIRTEHTEPMRLILPEAPVFAAAWPRPAGADKIDPAFEVVQAILAGGPGSRLYNELLVESKVASRLSINSHFPGGRYPGLFLIEAEPLPTRAPEDVEAAIVKIIESVGKDGVTPAELVKGKNWWRHRFLTDARSDAGRAQQLARHLTEQGTYKVEDVLARLDAVTAEDCQRVASTYLAGKPYFSIVQLTAINPSGASR